MYTPFTSRHFTTHIDPVSKARFAVLSTRVAPMQLGFYFVNSNWSEDGRYFWFYCAFPPAKERSLAVIDFLTDEIHHFPETATNASWLVDPRTGNLYWGTVQGFYMRTPHPQDKPVLVAHIPPICAQRGVTSPSTHLTFTPDYREILADMQTNMGSVIGTFDLATGEFTQWYETDHSTTYNHGQLNPVNGDLCLCAHESKFDPTTGHHKRPELVDGIFPRLQVIARDGTRTMLKPFANKGYHEFWAPDGTGVYYVVSACEEDGKNIAVIAKNLLDGSEPMVKCRVERPADVGIWHAHCSQDEKYFVMDASYGYGWRGCESAVQFYNTETGKLFRFLTKNPIVEGASREHPNIYHIDPHPRFVQNDTMIVFTTTVCGKVDVAVIDTAQLIEATA